MVKQNDFNENQEQQKGDENQEQMERKERGGNHNPQGANQYTEGRVDDRGRKQDEEHETKERGANQYTEGRNDDRGRKE